MRCFNHKEVDAVGICKNCNKGICHNCLTEVHNGIACSATCVDEVNAIDKLIQNNKDATKRKTNVRAYLTTSFFCISSGLVFIYSGIQYPGMGNFLLPAGIIFLLTGFAYFFITRKKVNGNK